MTPTGAQSSATSPRRPWPNLVLALPTDRCHPRIAWATICRYLCLLGRQHPECPSFYLFWVLFCTEREHRSNFPGERQKTGNQEEAAAAGLGRSGPTWAPAFGDLPQRPLSPGLSWWPAEGTGPGTSACCPRSVLLSWTRPLLLPWQSPSVTSGLGPEQTRTSHALWTFCIFSNCHRKDDPKHECPAVTITPGADWGQPHCLPPIPMKP